MQLTQLTDFQKDCLVKAKDHLNKIPRYENNVIRWTLMPGKVAVIVDLWKQSKLSAEAFADALMITKSLLPKFAKGKTSSNDKWPELLALLKPEEAEKLKVTKEKQKSEKVVEDAIFKVLLRDQIREIGLRTETIATEISSYPSRFVSTCLGRLERQGRLIKFKGEDKYTKWKVVDRTKTELRITELEPLILKIKTEVGSQGEIIQNGVVIRPPPPKSIDPVIPEVKTTEEPKIERIELPGKEIIEDNSVNNYVSEMSFYRNLKLEDLQGLTKEYVIIHVPLNLVSQFQYPLDKWSEIIYQVKESCPKLIPEFEQFFKSGSYLDMLRALEKAKLRMKLNSFQEVIDRFNLILDSTGMF